MQHDKVKPCSAARYRCSPNMKFAHLIEINDPLNPLIDALTRAQLWRGLLLRAENPKLFVPHLDACAILARSPESIERELRYGELTIRDRVTFLAQLQVKYHVSAQRDMAASSLTMTIEEPQPDLLFVRFDYADNVEVESSVDAFYNEFRRSAYQASDIDTVRVIRQLAEQGLLDI